MVQWNWNRWFANARTDPTNGQIGRALFAETTLPRETAQPTHWSTPLRDTPTTAQRHDAVSQARPTTIAPVLSEAARTRRRNDRMKQRQELQIVLQKNEHKRNAQVVHPKARRRAAQFTAAAGASRAPLHRSVTVQRGLLLADSDDAHVYALGTWDNYGNALRKFIAFLDEYAAHAPNAPRLPAEPPLVRSFLALHAASTKSAHSVDGMCKAINAVYTFNNISTLSITNIITRARSSSKRKYGRARRQKIPFEAKQVEHIMVKWGNSPCPVKRMIALIAALLFAATLRWDDAKKMTELHLSLKAGPHDEDRIIPLTNGKADTTFRGDARPLPARRDVPDGDLRCPINLARHVLDHPINGLGGRGLARLFVGIRAGNNQRTRLDFTRELSDSSMRHWLRKAWVECCPGVTPSDARLAGGHSGRIGARNANAKGTLPRAELDASGGWRSREASLGYETVDSRLELQVRHSIW
jgi:hypothetical protein